MQNSMQHSASQHNFADTRNTAAFCGLSTSTLKRLRLSGHLAEGIHWSRVGGKVLFYLPLLRDWIVNQGDPAAHDRAIQNYLVTLPSNRRKALSAS